MISFCVLIRDNMVAGYWDGWEREGAGEGTAAAVPPAQAHHFATGITI